MKDNILIFFNLIYSESLIGFIQYNLSKKSPLFENYFLRKSAFNNYNIAQYELANEFKNKGEYNYYIKFLELSSKNKYQPAIKDIADIYYNGDIVNKNWNKSFNLYNQLINKNTVTYCRLIEIQEKNKIEVTTKELVRWYDFLAKCSFKIDYYKVSKVYGKENKNHKALYFMEKSANQGHPEARKIVANIYYNRGEKAMESIIGETDDGRSTYTYKESNPKAAFYNYSKAADYGSRKAYFKLGYFYEHGFVVERNLKTALKIYEDAVKSGEIEYENKIYELKELLYIPSDFG